MRVNDYWIIAGLIRRGVFGAMLVFALDSQKRRPRRRWKCEKWGRTPFTVPMVLIKVLNEVIHEERILIAHDAWRLKYELTCGFHIALFFFVFHSFLLIEVVYGFPLFLTRSRLFRESPNTNCSVLAPQPSSYESKWPACQRGSIGFQWMQSNHEGHLSGERDHESLRCLCDKYPTPWVRMEWFDGIAWGACLVWHVSEVLLDRSVDGELTIFFIKIFQTKGAPKFT